MEFKRFLEKFGKMSLIGIQMELIDCIEDICESVETPIEALQNNKSSFEIDVNTLPKADNAYCTFNTEIGNRYAKIDIENLRLGKRNPHFPFAMQHVKANSNVSVELFLNTVEKIAYSNWKTSGQEPLAVVNWKTNYFDVTYSVFNEKTNLFTKRHFDTKYYSSAEISYSKSYASKPKTKEEKEQYRAELDHLKILKEELDMYSFPRDWKKEFNIKRNHEVIEHKMLQKSSTSNKTDSIERNNNDDLVNS